MSRKRKLTVANVVMLRLNLPFDKLVKNGSVYCSFNFLQIRLQNTQKHTAP